ncbi:GNAT family N-acetyltransferase [Streptomyces sp. NPDC004051]
MANSVDADRIVLRPARPSDSASLAALAHEAYGKYLGLVDEPPAPILLDYDEVASSGRAHVAEEDGRVVGMVTVERDDPHLILRNLAVRPACQGLGIGRLLVAFVEDSARAAGLAGVRLWTRAEMTDNIAFYRRLDYVLTHSERGAGAHRVFFSKELARTLPTALERTS